MPSYLNCTLIDSNGDLKFILVCEYSVVVRIRRASIHTTLLFQLQCQYYWLIRASLIVCNAKISFAIDIALLRKWNTFCPSGDTIRPIAKPNLVAYICVHWQIDAPCKQWSEIKFGAGHNTISALFWRLDKEWQAREALSFEWWLWVCNLKTRLFLGSISISYLYALCAVFLKKTKWQQQSFFCQ